MAGQLGQPKTGFGAYQIFGDLRLTRLRPHGGVTGYRRDLDIADATAGVEYTAGGVHVRAGVLRLRAPTT